MCSKPIYDGPRVRSLETFVRRAVWQHGEKYDYSKSVYIDGSTPVVIICPIHGEFSQAPKNHITSGCRQCAIDQSTETRRKNKEKRLIDEFVEVHGQRYDYSKVFYVNQQTPITIVCPDHGPFDQFDYVHKRGSGCPKCAIEQKKISRRNKRKLTLIEEFREVHGDQFDYSKVLDNFVNVDSKVPVICKLHGEFYISPSSHLSGIKGCGECRNIELKKQRILSPEECIEKVRERNPFAYSYDYIYDKESITNGMQGEAKVFCKIHQLEFTQSLEAARHGAMCPMCRKEKIRENRRLSRDEFIEKSIKVHGDRYVYDDVDYTETRGKVVVKCKIHGKFTLTANRHLRGQGCQKCSIIGSASGIIKRGEDGRTGSIYVAEMTSEKESFVKVGISRNINSRMSALRRETGMNVNLILCESTSLYSAAVIEKLVRMSDGSKQYKPSIDFGGKTECYEMDSKEIILEIISNSL